MEKYEGVIHGVLTAFVLCVAIVQVSSCTKNRDTEQRVKEESIIELKKTCIKQGGSVILGEQYYNIWNCVQGNSQINKEKM